MSHYVVQMLQNNIICLDVSKQKQFPTKFIKGLAEKVLTIDNLSTKTNVKKDNGLKNRPNAIFVNYAIQEQFGSE
jgi:hypothetical protein